MTYEVDLEIEQSILDCFANNVMLDTEQVEYLIDKYSDISKYRFNTRLSRYISLYDYDDLVQVGVSKDGNETIEISNEIIHFDVDDINHPMDCVMRDKYHSLFDSGNEDTPAVWFRYNNTIGYPSVINCDGSYCYKNNKHRLHRVDGPAVISRRMDYWLDGKHLNEAELFAKVTEIV